MLIPDAIREFVTSMPVRYSETFSVFDMQQHARIVQARGEQPAHVGQFASTRARGTALCVVATDRPGLLATISAALSLAGLAILEADIFTRHASPSLSEAVDLFWVIRRTPLQHLAVAPADVRRVGHHLAYLISNSDPVLPARASVLMRRVPEMSTLVRFIEDPRGRFTILEIDADDRPGLFLAISRAVFSARVQIVGSHFRAERGRSRGRFELTELDESPPGTERRQDIQMAILKALDDLTRPMPRFVAG